MSEERLTYKDCYEAVESLADEMLSEYADECETLEDFMDEAHPYIDQHEFVIYYHKAHQFVDAMHHEHYDAAEEMIRDTEYKAESFNHYASIMAYWGMTIWVSGMIESKLEEREESETNDHETAEA